MSASKQQSNRIGEIVQQVKSGQKDKSAAFAELQDILRSSSHSDSINDGSNIDGPESGDQYDNMPEGEYDAGSISTTGAAATASRISQEDRRMLINKLIEKKRQNRTSSHTTEYSENLQEYIDDEDQQQYQGGVSSRGGNNSYFTRASMDDSYAIQGGDSRSNRIAQTEAAIRQEMFKECRFRPVIKELPSFYGGSKDKDSDFYDRVTKWQREKDAEASRRKQAMDNSDLVGCTFQPKINRNSERAVKEIRGEVNESTTDRLYKSNELAINQRSKYIEDEILRERQEEEAVCTFQPKLNMSKRFSQVKSKFTKIEKKKDVPPEERPEVKLCTFTPKVKGVRPSMSSAQLYISSDVVERLTRPIIAGPPDDSMTAFDTAYGPDRPAMDMASFMGTLEGKFKGAPERPSSAPARSGRPTEMSEDEIKARKAQFEQFLGRQQQQQIKREKHIEQVRSITIVSITIQLSTRSLIHVTFSLITQYKQKSKHLTPTYQPKLCRKSIELATSHQKGEFLERLERDVVRRVKDESKKITEADPECTFKPEISSSGSALRPRTTFELSRGDLLRKETNAKMAKLRTDQEQMVELTFKPTITKKAQRQSTGSSGTTKLSISADPTKYLLVQKEKKEHKEAQAKADLMKREEEELLACTFAPSTKECPAYVKRIAKSMSVMRAARSGTQEVASGGKPDWK